MKYKERLCIIFMRDNGPRRSFRVHRGSFYAALVFFACLPLLVGALGWQAWRLWQENALLRDNVLRFESDCQEAQAIAERLENLEELLREDGVPGRELVLSKLASAEQAQRLPAAAPARDPRAPDQADDAEDGARQLLDEGPGHDEFPAIDVGYVKVDNVQARALHDRKLRIALDLRNTDNQKIASGTVLGTLITADGAKIELGFEQEDVGNFRISRFKRTVMVARLPGQASLVNAQVILEVRTQDKKVVYRNIFAVER